MSAVAEAMRSMSRHVKPETVRSPATAFALRTAVTRDVQRRRRAGDPDFARRRRNRVGERLVKRARGHAQVRHLCAVQPPAQRVGEHAERQDVGRIRERA